MKMSTRMYAKKSILEKVRGASRWAILAVVVMAEASTSTTMKNVMMARATLTRQL